MPWFVKQGGKTRGPLEASQLKDLAANGSVTPDTEVAQSEAGPWVAAIKVRGLFVAPAPVTTVPVASAPPPDKQVEKACPFCGESILVVAIKCKHCGEMLGECFAAQPQSGPHSRESTSRQPSTQAAAPEHSFDPARVNPWDGDVNVTIDQPMASRVAGAAIEIANGNFRVLRHARKWNSNAYVLDSSPGPFTLQRHAVDSMHLVKADVLIMSPLQAFLFYFFLGTLFFPVLIGVLSFLVFIVFFPPTAANAGKLDGLLWWFYGLGALMFVSLAGFMVVALCIKRSRFKYILKINTSAKHLFVPFITKADGEAAMALLSSSST
jgi:hypothetical protein